MSDETESSPLAVNDEVVVGHRYQHRALIVAIEADGTLTLRFEIRGFDPRRVRRVAPE